MIPKFYENKFSILETKSVLQRRDRMCQKVCQIITYKFENEKFLQHISVVYRAPDSDITSDEALLGYIENCAQIHKNYVAVGDFNIDVKKASGKKKLKTSLGHSLSQKVNGYTRVAKHRDNKGKQITSKTAIDLVFLDTDLNEKFKNICRTTSQLCSARFDAAL